MGTGEKEQRAGTLIRFTYDTECDIIIPPIGTDSIKKTIYDKGDDEVQRVDRLLETPCYIVDFLPQQVPKDCGGQFFKVENYFLNEYERYGISNKFIRIILKAMCYYPVSVHWGKWIEQPKPEQVAEIINTIMENHSGDMNMVFTSKDALLQFGWDCLNISLYNPDEEMRILFEKIATSEGMFWRKAD